MIFLDVGAHEGQTLAEITRPRYSFERIYAFEPMPVQYATLVERYGSHAGVALLNYGLAEQSGAAQVYGDNSRLEASLFRTKVDVDLSHVTECEFTAADEWFRANVPYDAKTIVKLNCEGAEVPILDSLIESGEIWKVWNVMIDFDIRFVAGHEFERERILGRLADIHFDRYCLEADVMVGQTHQDRIGHWLAGLGL